MRDTLHTIERHALQLDLADPEISEEDKAIAREKLQALKREASSLMDSAQQKADALMPKVVNFAKDSPLPSDFWTTLKSPDSVSLGNLPEVPREIAVFLWETLVPSNLRVDAAWHVQPDESDIAPIERIREAVNALYLTKKSVYEDEWNIYKSERRKAA